ncbi:Pantothenate synthetase [Roseivivax sp. THAF40]|nr:MULTISPECIES: pantoate--beta-alanine ligase [unclassified Roseivivax]QFS84374.1 Pantothenate synthetase [Roseivivax sp. THAF197b]QFT48202.1 Pantothenate synthetase [Roseivivax sp. THAF40]
MTRILRTRAELRQVVAGWRAAGETIGVVPTMGALHDGHLSLVAAAKDATRRVIVTIFVNPKQFNNAGDLAAYPRTEDSDAAKLAPFDVDAIYVPDPDQIYPEGFVTNVSVAAMTDVLCGAHRPGHFDGVATVVAKLFLQTGADRAFFGEKDFQQLQVVRRMATDLDIDIEVTGCPTIRDADGLALSSRNTRLSPEARLIAPTLHREMRQIASAMRGGAEASPEIARATNALIAAGFERVEYLEARAVSDLSLVTRLDAPARLFAAAWLDGVRLIDNIAI